MYIVITYDINVTSTEGQRRLRKVAQVCTNYGQRVQNSVFECKVNEGELLIIKKSLLKIIDKTTDSVRIYRLGEHYNKKVIHIGVKESYSFDEALIV